VLTAKVAARVLPFRFLWRALEGGAAKAGRVDPNSVERTQRIAWAISAAGAKAGASCVPQALAACFLLRTARLPYVARVGVMPGDGGAPRAHIWVESLGKVVAGGNVDLPAYAPLLRTRENPPAAG
jgi:hypothetical protein